MVTETYLRLEKWLDCIARDFQITHGGDLEELRSEANVGLVASYPKYDANVSTPMTFFTVTVWRHLLNYHRKESTQVLSGFNSRLLADIETQPPTICDGSPDYLEALSETGKLVVDLVIDPPDYFQDQTLENTPVSWRKAIRTHLRNLGWTWTEIKTTFAELREVF